jgi:DNA mismatch repair protein MSH6
MVLAELDCLLSLARCSAGLSEPKCRPVFVEPAHQHEPGVLEMEDLRHPCIPPEREASFIPNTVNLGSAEGRMIILTGPNMGGKSTLLRQTCLATVMAQIGCWVPAASCRLSPVDRIFTRLGANDNILAGQSTFMVELTETSRILHEATHRSLVILDELGRGTSTFDGLAIAQAVLAYLVEKIRCMGLFATHYRQLAVDLVNDKRVACSHMSCNADSVKYPAAIWYTLYSLLLPSLVRESPSCIS